MRGLLALENIDFKKHTAVITYFREKYIRTEVFDKSLSRIITDLFHLRGQSDYGEFFVIAKTDVVKQIENAEYFLTQIKACLDKQQ